MKKYDTVKKKWVNERELTKDSLKTRKNCRGGKPHDYRLVLPDYIARSVNTTNISEEKVKLYYDSEDRIEEFIKLEKEKLVKIGIKTYRFSRSSKFRYIECSVCGKKEYKETKLLLKAN